MTRQRISRAAAVLAAALLAAALLAPAAGAVTFQAVIAGDCPGEATVTVAGATPDGAVDLFRGSIEGDGTIPSGPCAGGDSGLADPSLLASVTADADGVFHLTTELPASACGTLLEGVDATTCAVTPVDRLAAGHPAPTPITGRRTSLADGDDGDLERGVAWPEPRFSLPGDGTVVDQLTGLVWLRDADCYGSVPWTTALAEATALGDGLCGLADGSAPGDWRLPNLRALAGLIDYERSDPALPADHPFLDVVSSGYWSSTPSAGSAEIWGVRLGSGEVGLSDDPTGNYVLPVRGGR